MKDSSLQVLHGEQTLPTWDGNGLLRCRPGIPQSCPQVLLHRPSNCRRLPVVALSPPVSGKWEELCLYTFLSRCLLRQMKTVHFHKVHRKWT